MEKKDTFIAAIKASEMLIYKISSVYTDTAEDRQDLMQEIIYNLWKSFDSFSQRSSLTTWIYRVAMNVAIYHLKQRKRRVSTIPIGENDLQIRDTESTDSYEERLAVLRRHLVDFNLLEKGIVMLYLEDKNYAEIAEIVGISESNVGTRMSRIKEKLRKQITK